MEFNKLHSDTPNCNCLNGTKENTIDTFTRKIYFNPPKDSDFNSQWERVHWSRNLQKPCEEICGDKGVSINKLDVDNENKIRKKYIDMSTTTSSLSPNIKKREIFFLKFKFHHKAGKVKHTKKRGDFSHHDLYKSDVFTVNTHIKIIEITPL